jgi:hypothetical protein
MLDEWPDGTAGDTRQCGCVKNGMKCSSMCKCDDDRCVNCAAPAREANNEGQGRKRTPTLPTLTTRTDVIQCNDVFIYVVKKTHNFIAN